MMFKEIYFVSWMNLLKLVLINFIELMFLCFDENDSVI